MSETSQPTEGLKGLPSSKKKFNDDNYKNLCLQVPEETHCNLILQSHLSRDLFSKILSLCLQKRKTIKGTFSEKVLTMGFFFFPFWFFFHSEFLLFSHDKGQVTLRTQVNACRSPVEPTPVWDTGHSPVDRLTRWCKSHSYRIGGDGDLEGITDSYPLPLSLEGSLLRTFKRRIHIQMVFGHEHDVSSKDSVHALMCILVTSSTGVCPLLGL